jgi:glucans biosynthesis protein C
VREDARRAAQTAASTTGRLLFVDNVRTFLTIVVVLHHLMITYAGTGAWYYIEGRQDTATTALGGWFNFVNQSYFMGLFFLISAYFVPGSYDRKGAARFLKERLIRLGIPLLVFSWVFAPLLVYAVLTVLKGPQGPIWRLPQILLPYEAALGAGPLWFVETLLIFSVLYVLWRLVARRRPATQEPACDLPGPRAIVLFALLVAATTFLVRWLLQRAPNFRLLDLLLPSLAQHAALFAVGLVAYRRNWLLRLPDATGRLWLRVAIALVLVFPILAVGSGALRDFGPLAGGWHWQTAAYALWESFLGVSLCIGLLYLFRRRWPGQGVLAKELSANAYAVYVVHTPVIMFVALAARGLQWHPLLKFVLAAAVSLPLCFALSHLLRKLPWAKRVLG